ncbi:MAG: alpha/beta hydrolase-fold protein [Bacteroidota bacterium]
MKKFLHRCFIALPAAVLLLHAALPAKAQLSIRLNIAAEAKTPATDTLYVAGSFNSWNPGNKAYMLQKLPNGQYGITLPATVRGSAAFKFTRGSWQKAEATATGADAPNRSFIIPERDTATYTGTVFGWTDNSARPKPRSTAGKNVSVMQKAFFIPQLNRERQIWIYLPPDYKTSSKTYPVLYMHDGQNLFDQSTGFAGEWGIDETLDSLHAAGDHGCIVIGIENDGENRFNEYSPWNNPKYGGGQGDAYITFITETLKPYVDKNYRTMPESRYTCVFGSSMGGLISLYAALRHPGVFGRAGVFSPSLWFAPEIYKMADTADATGFSQRIYIMSGEKESKTQVAEQLRMVEKLKKSGFSEWTSHESARRLNKSGSPAKALKKEYFSVIHPDGEHSEWFWKREFAHAYKTIFSGAVKQ